MEELTNLLHISNIILLKKTVIGQTLVQINKNLSHKTNIECLFYQLIKLQWQYFHEWLAVVYLLVYNGWYPHLSVYHSNVKIMYFFSWIKKNYTLNYHSSSHSNNQIWPCTTTYRVKSKSIIFNVLNASYNVSQCVCSTTWKTVPFLLNYLKKILIDSFKHKFFL